MCSQDLVSEYSNLKFIFPKMEDNEGELIINVPNCICQQYSNSIITFIHSFHDNLSWQETSHCGNKMTDITQCKHAYSISASSGSRAQYKCCIIITISNAPSRMALGYFSRLQHLILVPLALDPLRLPPARHSFAAEYGRRAERESASVN